MGDTGIPPVVLTDERRDLLTQLHARHDADGRIWPIPKDGLVAVSKREAGKP